MGKVMKLEILGLHDQSFLLDDDDNHHTIVAVGIFEKFDYVTMKMYLAEKSKVIDKAKTKLVKKFGLWWHQALTEEEWKSQLPNVFSLVQGVKGEKQLQEFAVMQQANYDMHDAPQYKLYLIPDYKPDQSAIIFKIHHNMSDGLGIATLFQCYNGNYDSTALPSMRPIPFCKRFIIGLISPLLVIWTVLSI